MVRNIVPLHKKGSTNNPEHYRGITLLSVLGTRLLNKRLTSWTESYSVNIEAQAGFRSAMSTSDNIFVLHGINQGKNCVVVSYILEKRLIILNVTAFGLY